MEEIVTVNAVLPAEVYRSLVCVLDGAHAGMDLASLLVVLIGFQMGHHQRELDGAEDALRRVQRAIKHHVVIIGDARNARVAATARLQMRPALLTPDGWYDGDFIFLLIGHSARVCNVCVCTCISCVTENKDYKAIQIERSREIERNMDRW